MPNFITLLVEDDAFQREIIADVLRSDGFEVVECVSAEAAELIISSTGANIRALVTDQNVAGQMLGTDLAQYARRRFPHMNIVVISGTAVDHLPPYATFLQKPFSGQQLLEMVR